MEEILKYQEGKKIWFTSDLHLGHDKEFIWHARGFESVEEMNEKIIANLQATVVGDDDMLFILGDLMLGGAAADPGYWLQRLPGRQVEIILGNHDTNKREEAYAQFYPVFDARRLRYKARDGKTYYFYLSHYPTLTSNYDDATKPLSARLINLYGHSHQTTNFFMDDNGNVQPCMYHIGVDSHSCQPVEIENIIAEIKEKYYKGEYKND